jgi:predicted Zn-dependent protease with MMP-like domain
LQAYESHVGEKDYDVLLVIAYALDLPQSFLKISREIIIKRQGPLTNFPPAELLPEAVLGKV